MEPYLAERILTKYNRSNLKGRISDTAKAAVREVLKHRGYSVKPMVKLQFCLPQERGDFPLRVLAAEKY